MMGSLPGFPACPRYWPFFFSLFFIVIYIILVCNCTLGVSSAWLPNSQFGNSREDSLSYVIIIVIYFIFHIKSLSGSWPFSKNLPKGSAC